MYTHTCVAVYGLVASKQNESHLATLRDDDGELRLVVGSNWDILVGQRNTHSTTDVQTTQLHH